MPIPCQSGCCGHYPVTQEQTCGCYAYRKTDNHDIINELTDPELKMMPKMEKVSQTHPCLGMNTDPCAPSHNEYVCHGMGEKRQHYLKEVKRILDRLDEMECPTKENVEQEKGTAGGMLASERPIIKFPGYADLDCPKFKRSFFAPLLESMERGQQTFEGDGGHTMDDVECKAWHLPRQRSFELKGGILMKGCDCAKHNGIQDKCVRSECYGKPKCLTQPEPSCLPSQGYMNPPPQRPVDDMVREVVYSRQLSRANKSYCCCPIERPGRETLPQKPVCPPVSGKMKCYKCCEN